MADTMTTLIDAYTSAVQRGDIHDDPEQRRVLLALQDRIDAVLAKHTWYRFAWRKQKGKGLYIVGQVGIGKTYIMDLFYQQLPDQYKLRAHFLIFMQQIDQKLRFLQGQRDPILKIAKDLAHHYHVICLDEFMVEDIAHAMILGELLQALFKLGVLLVTTSNTKIDDLYKGGLNRERFLPALALLHHYCDEMMLKSSVDYRLGKSLHLHAYLYPLNAANAQMMRQQFQTLADMSGNADPIIVQSRSIEVVQVSTAVVWFEFATICAMPRCQLDYIELAERYHTMFVSNVPQLHSTETTIPVVLFIQLVDVLYDRGIRLILSAAVPTQALYPAGPMVSQFARTLSRLGEMQSEYYLNKYCNIDANNS